MNNNFIITPGYKVSYIHTDITKPYAILYYNGVGCMEFYTREELDMKMAHLGNILDEYEAEQNSSEAHNPDDSKFPFGFPQEVYDEWLNMQELMDLEKGRVTPGNGAPCILIHFNKYDKK